MSNIKLFLAVLVLLSGCASAPYINRVITDENGSKTTYKFAYGKFCGPEYPKLSQKQALIDLWPPLDDIDALCYAHDYCYVLTTSNGYYCDAAMRDASLQLKTSLPDMGCWDVLTELFLAFFSKPYSKGSDAAEDFSVKATGLTIGLAAGSSMQILKAPLTLFTKPAVEGTCNTAKGADPKTQIRLFQDAYMNANLNDARLTIAVPVPD